MEAADGILYCCKARGGFRKDGITPLPGDIASFSADGENGYILSLKDRKNSLIRPPVANVDRLCIVLSTCQPKPFLELVDRLIAIAEYKDIEPVIVITKSDLQSSEPVSQIYQKVGIPVFEINPLKQQELLPFYNSLKEGLSVFCGNSGVGKSTLLNLLDEDLSLPTGEISQKLGRGRHTTRHTELLRLKNGSLVADTPGFSALDISKAEIIPTDMLSNCFREFSPFQDHCRFTGCTHTCEAGCTVLEAVRSGEIPSTRHESYKNMYSESKSVKDWEFPSNKKRAKTGGRSR